MFSSPNTSCGRVGSGVILIVLLYRKFTAALLVDGKRPTPLPSLRLKYILDLISEGYKILSEAELPNSWSMCSVSQRYFPWSPEHESCQWCYDAVSVRWNFISFRKLHSYCTTVRVACGSIHDHSREVQPTGGKCPLKVDVWKYWFFCFDLRFQALALHCKDQVTQPLRCS